MKIYILRHEDRTQDATFFSPLTKNGLENSNKLIDILKKLNIKTIYSSPFIRTLQTIYPFAKANELSVKIDYGLSEIKSDYLIPKNSHAIRLPEYLNGPFLISADYRSSIEAEDLKFPENELDVQKRTKAFLKNVIGNHGNSDDNILIVTHQVVCNIFLKIVNKFSQKLEVTNNYPIGGLTLVFNNLDWVFEPINWKNK